MAGRDDGQKEADEELSVALLAGVRSHTGGALHDLKPGTPEEKKARAALARRVRESMPGFAGELLALAIDPNTKSRIPGMTPTRRIKFENPNKGHSSRWRRNLIIADFIRWRVNQGDKREIAYEKACKEFGISRSVAQEIWNWHTSAMRDASAGS